MTEEKKAAPAAAKPSAQSRPSPALEPAAASSDPAVHQALAELQTARSNGNQEEVQAVTRRLAGLGFE